MGEAVNFSPGDSDQLITALEDRCHRYVHNNQVFSPDGKLVASVSDDKTIRLFDAANGKEIGFFYDERESSPVHLDWIHDGTGFRVASANKVNVYDVKSQRLLQSYVAHSVPQVSFHPPGNYLASPYRTVKIWDFKMGQLKYKLYGHEQGGVTSVKFSPCGGYLASGGKDGKVLVWKTTLF